MPKNSQQDQKQARQKKNRMGALALGSQCRDRYQLLSSAPELLKTGVCP